MENQISIPADQLIPHRYPMQLVEKLLFFDGERGVVSAQVHHDNLFLQEGGTLAESAMVELLAQAYAAVQGYSDSRSGKPVRQGFLVGVRKIIIAEKAKRGDSLLVHVRPTAQIDGFAVVEGKVCRGNETLAHGNLKLWIPVAEEAEE